MSQEIGFFFTILSSIQFTVVVAVDEQKKHGIHPLNGGTHKIYVMSNWVW